MSSPIQQPHPGPTILEQTGQCLRQPRPGRLRHPHQHWHRGRSSGGSGPLFACVSSLLISLTRPTTLRTSMSVQLFHHQSAPTTKTDTLVPCVPSPGKRPYNRATYDSAITVKATVISTLGLGIHRCSTPPPPVGYCGSAETSGSSSVSSPSSHTIMYSAAEAGLRLTGSDGFAFTIRSIIDGGPLPPFPFDG